MKNERPSIDRYFITIAEVVATRSTCLHRKCGAIIVIDKHIISCGYNGVAPSQMHCGEWGYCAKDREEPCRAEGLHAESNAVAWAASIGISVFGATLYTTFSPCRACCNLLAVTGIKWVKYKEVYDSFPEGPRYLKSLGIKVEKI